MLVEIEPIIAKAKSIAGTTPFAVPLIIREMENAKPADVEVIKWISVNERLPDKEGSYLVLGRSGGAYVMYFHKNEYNPVGKFNNPYITHWAERPQLSKK